MLEMILWLVMVSDNFRIAQHLRDRRPWPFVGLQDFLSFVAM